MLKCFGRRTLSFVYGFGFLIRIVKVGKYCCGEKGELSLVLV